ncbi:MAG: hypothetical protein AB1499_06445 [Nitrospirota bacterium]
MSDKAEITIRIPSDASSHGSRPYLEHAEFVRYCTANSVPTSESDLEQYEKNKLLFPCYRLLYPRELLRRAFRTRHAIHSQSYKIRREWEPLIVLENQMLNSQHWMFKEFEDSIDHGHPLDQAVDNNNPFLIRPEVQKIFRWWDRYKVIVDKCGTNSLRESRAIHYYATWKIFIVYELNEENTDEHNRATGSRRGWGILSEEKRHSSLTEFCPFLRIVSSFEYRRSLLRTYYFEKTSKEPQDWKEIIQKKRLIAQRLYSGTEYIKWIRFLRKLIEIHESYRGNEKILLSLEAKEFIARTAIFLKYVTNYAFERICDDVSGRFKNCRSLCRDDSVFVYPGKLKELFADEKWDLERNVRWRVNDALKDFNNSLNSTEKLPSTLGDDLMDALSVEPHFTALAAIKKINDAYFDRRIWRETDVWSGVRDLAVSVEVHGKEWVGGRMLNDVLTRLFPYLYDTLKKNTGIRKPVEADNAHEFLKKLIIFQKKIPLSGERCGRHILIAHLTRNCANHQKGLTSKQLIDNISIIYASLLNTLFVLYAHHKNV